MAVIATFNAIFAAPVYGFDVWYSIIATVIAVVAVVAVDGLFAFVIRHMLPARWFDENNTKWTPSKKTCIFYEKIGVKKWKDKVLELGFFAGFRKNKLLDPANNEYVARFITEANYGIVIHVFGMIFGFSIMAFYPKYALIFGLPVAVVNLFLNYLSFVILRYNLPKLRILYKRNARRTEAAIRGVNENSDGKTE